MTIVAAIYTCKWPKRMRKCMEESAPGPVTYAATNASPLEVASTYSALSDKQAPAIAICGFSQPAKSA